MSIEEKKLYCIWGLILAAASSSRDDESYEALKEAIKTNHIPENACLITEDSFQLIMKERCAPEFLSGVLDSILAEYEELGYVGDIEECGGCRAIPKK